MSAAEDGVLADEAGSNARGEISMGGFFGGLIAGAIAVLALGVVLSVTTPLSRKPDVVETAPEVSKAPQVAEPVEPDDTGAEADLVEVTPSGPERPEDPSGSLASLEGIELEPGARPEAAATPSSPETPQTTTAPVVSVQTEAPAAPQTPVAAPEPAQPEAAPVVITDAPPPPEPEQTPEPQVVEATPEEQVVESAPQEDAPQVAVVEPEPESVPEIESLPQENPIAVEGEEDTRPVRQPRVLTLPQIGGEQSESSGTLIGKRVVPLTERDNPPAETPEVVVATKPIDEYAASFDNPEAKPLMSIILIDDEGAFGAEALQDFPYPISFAVSPNDPDAAEKMVRHREAGFEVLALIDLHEAASAQDAEVSLSVWLDELPYTVGLLEGVESGIQGNRKLADQVAAIAGGTGRGLVTQDSGLNTVQKLAARNGIPSSVVFRDFDGARQDPKVMRRFLDQAAFRAGQEGAVVMLGRLRPETISALLLWGLEDRGNRVAMAPISAVMLNEVQQDDSGS